MSNETDLDWLARNVHDWPDNSCGYIHVMEIKEVCYPSWSRYGGDNKFSKSQWITRRAELQNKPSWKDAPEWARWLAQDRDGGWWFYRCEPTLADSVWRGVDRYFSKTGEVISDWRDTLDSRPEASESFKPFTSIEDNQEQDMKQDSGWFERGELPPVGTECEIRIADIWRPCFMIGLNRKGNAVIEYGAEIIEADNCRFRPIRTEREKAVEEIGRDIAERWANCEELAKHLIDKGWVKEKW